MRRLAACVERWPEAEEGKYDPRCCRFPKSCSCTVYDPKHVAGSDLERMPEKLVRDGYEYVPHRVAGLGERYMLLAAKFDEEVAEVKAAKIGTDDFIEELGDLIEVCYAIGGGRDRVEAARLRKLDRKGGFEMMLVIEVPR